MALHRSILSFHIDSRSQAYVPAVYSVLAAAGTTKRTARNTARSGDSPLTPLARQVIYEMLQDAPNPKRALTRVCPKRIFSSVNHDTHHSYITLAPGASILFTRGTLAKTPCRGYPPARRCPSRRSRRSGQARRGIASRIRSTIGFVDILLLLSFGHAQPISRRKIGWMAHALTGSGMHEADTSLSALWRP